MSTIPSSSQRRYFTSYSGVKLPLNLVNLLEDDQLTNRNTYFRATFDANERMSLCEKVVYGEVEMSHRYEYHRNGALKSAEITDADEEVSLLHFDEYGIPLPTQP